MAYVGQVQFDFRESGISNETLEYMSGVKNSLLERVISVNSTVSSFFSPITACIHFGEQVFTLTASKIKIVTGTIINGLKGFIPENIQESCLNNSPIVLSCGILGICHYMPESEMKQLAIGTTSLCTGALLWVINTKEIRILDEQNERYVNICKETTDKYQKKHKIQKIDTKDRFQFDDTGRMPRFLKIVSGVFMVVGVSYLLMASSQFLSKEGEKKDMPAQLIDVLFKCPTARKIWEKASFEVGHNITIAYAEGPQSHLALPNMSTTTIHIKRLSDNFFGDIFEAVFGSLCNIRNIKDSRAISQKALAGFTGPAEFIKAMFELQWKSQGLACEAHLGCVKGGFWSSNTKAYTYCEKLIDTFNGFLKDAMPLVRTYDETLKRATGDMVNYLANTQLPLCNSYKEEWDYKYKDIYARLHTINRK